MSWIKRAVVLSAVALLAGAVLTAGPSPAAAAKLEVGCTNSASDAALINATIAGSDAGDEIVFSGTCLISESITLVGDRAYRGESRTGTVLRQADGANLDAILASESYRENIDRTGIPMSIRSLTLDGNWDNNTAPTNGIILRSWLTVIEDLAIGFMDGNGILFSMRSEDGTAIEPGHTSVNGRIAANYIHRIAGHGVYVQDDGNALSDWNLLDNWIGLDIGGSGVYLENAAGWVIERNHIYDISEHGIFADRLWGSSVSDNFIEDFGRTSQTGTWYGIGATVQGQAASTINGNRVMNIATGLNQQSTYRYLGIDRVNYGVGVVSVTGNVIHGGDTSLGTGLFYALGPGDELNVASSGNMVNNVATALDTDGDPVTVVFSDSEYQP